MYRNDKVIRRYSEPFKLKILAELTIGKHTNNELCKLYSIDQQPLINGFKSIMAKT
jgi:putative transposase